ncbi:MAG TPA: hypothetical protein VK486_01170 [Thermoleophilaceae bacterium]|nr:hypothetical protein [Thermoleophilaceae bacterium]
MRFRIRLSSVALALLLCALSAAPAIADPFEQWFSDGYRNDVPPWPSLVPPPPLDVLPDTAYHGGRSCVEPTLSDARRRYCQLSRQCHLRPAGELVGWCDALGEVINDRYSLKACRLPPDSELPSCVGNRHRLERECDVQGSVAPQWEYVCAALRAAYPPAPPPAPEEPPEPGQPPGAPPEDETSRGGDTSGDIFGADSPWCERPGLDAAARATCDRSGSISREYPLSSYGIDSFIDLRQPYNLLPAAIQNTCRTIWYVVLFALNGVLLLQEWAFSLDLIGQALQRLRATLSKLHDDVLGDSWLVLAFSIIALFGMWSAFVRRRRIETLAGMGATVGMICLALVVIARPEATVGELSRMANEGSVSALTIVTQQDQDATEAYPRASRELFNLVVLPGWGALQFGDGAYHREKPGRICTKNVKDWRPDGDPECRDFGGTVADAWLAHPSGSDEREKLFWGLKAVDGRRVISQTAGGAITRPGLLVMLLFTCIGAIMLLGHFTIKLTMAALWTLALLLALPVMLIVPSFGEPGRRAFVGYARAGGGALIAKMVYALATAGVFVIADLIDGLRIGAFMTQVVLGVFFWSVWFRRNAIFGFLMPAGGAPSVQSMYYGAQMMRTVGRGAVGAATFPFRAVAGGITGVGRATRGAVVARTSARREAVANAAQRSLTEHAEDAVRTKKAEDMRRARSVVADEPQNRARLDGSRKTLTATEQELGTARQARDQLRGQRDALSPQDSGYQPLQQQLVDADARVERLAAQHTAQSAEVEDAKARLADVGWAQATVKQASANGEIPVRESEIRDHIAARQRLLARRPPKSDSHADAWERTLHTRSTGGRLSRRDRGLLKLEMRNSQFKRSVRRDAKRIRKEAKRRGRDRVGRR